MQTINLITRRGFFDRSFKLGLGVALSSLVDIPLVMKRALAEGTMGQGPNKKKLLFIFLRGANDGLNSVIPIQDPAYPANRPDILIPKDPATDYSASGLCDFPSGAAEDPTFGYTHAIRLGNGFAALHPSLKFFAPLINPTPGAAKPTGDLAIIHRVGYPRQSRSHFDSQNFWETGSPHNGLVRDGIFYRALIESGLTQTEPLTGVSIQSSLPLLLRGSGAAMTNLTDPLRYDLLGIPNSAAGNLKADDALRGANHLPFAGKRNRQLLSLQYENLVNTLSVFADIDFTENGNTFVDDAPTDHDFPYHLFPTTNAKNGGWNRPGGGTDPAKYVVDTGAYTFFNRLKAAALILNKTEALIAGTEFGGFDTHNNQGGVTGAHANLQRRIAWAMYALRKYFTLYADKAQWDNLVVVTLSEFGRTTVQNSDGGTDHAEAGAMFVAGGQVRGGVLGCRPDGPIPWVTGQTGSMFAVNNRYLKRMADYRSVLGELIRDHLGASQDQLNRIIPGYANEAAEHLRFGGTVAPPLDHNETPIAGELDIV
jgi:uncharacterized protein (DUF1501 family)